MSTDVVSEEVLLVNECYWQVGILAAVSRRGGVGGRSSRRILEEDQYNEGKTGKG